MIENDQEKIIQISLAALDQSTANFERNILDKLACARNMAMSHISTSRRLSPSFPLASRLSRATQSIPFNPSLSARYFLAASLLVCATLGAIYYNISSQTADYDEIDSAILSGELPLNAYLDHGFAAYLDKDR